MADPRAAVVKLSQDQHHQLESLVRAGSTPQALVFRCRIILETAQQNNPTNQAIAHWLECDRHTVGVWRQRFAQQGLAGLQDAPRCGRPRSVSLLYPA